MIVFEVYINGEKRAVSSVEKGVMSLVIDKVNESGGENVSVRLGGYEQANKRHMDWIRERLKEGDEVKLVIRQSENALEVSQPTSVREANEINDLVLQSKLKSYELLRKELFEKGLI